MKKKGKELTLKDMLIYDAIVLLLIGIFLFFVETRVTEYKQRENLFERLDSIQETFNKAYTETQEVTELYDESIVSRAKAIAYLYDTQGGIEVNRELADLYSVEGIYIGDFRKEQNMRYYTAYGKDGTAITVEKDPSDLNAILNNIYTDNKILQRVSGLDDLFFVITNSTGEIVYYPDPSYIGKNITALGITQSDLAIGSTKWLKIAGDRYFLSSVINENLDITISCGIDSSDMTKNSHIALSVIYLIMLVLFTTVICFTFFSMQERKRNRDNSNYSHARVAKKVTVFSLVGVLLVGAATYYVQTLFCLSLHSLGASNEIMEVKTTAAEAKNGAEKLTEQYNASYLTKARVTSYILSQHPELRTKEHLKELSDIFDFEFIVMYDTKGVEYLSDSYIVGFVISDDPLDQSYAFNVLKNGVPYVIQEAQVDELTGTYRQYIGVLTYDSRGDMDGFLQVAVSPEKLQSVIEEANLERILDSTIAGTDDEAFAVDISTGNIIYATGRDIVGERAVDHGFTEAQLRNNYYGNLNIDGTKYYASSFEVDGAIVYVTDKVSEIFSGRMLITAIAQIVAIFNLIGFTFYIRNKDVVLPMESGNDLYVDVKMAGGETKQTLNIITRMMKSRIDWADKTPEAKTGLILKYISAGVSVVIIIALLFRNVIYTDNTIFGFIVNGRWERGFNVFALTMVLVYMMIYSLAYNAVNMILDQFISLVNPKSETVIRLVKSFVRYTGSIAMLYFSLSLLGFDSQSLLASAGLLTLVVGLGAKDLITDILAGMFIIFENEFQVGDIIEVGGFKGRVLEIGIRTTRVMNTVQDIKSINNRNLTNIVNKTRNNSYCDVIVNVNFVQDVEKLEEILNRELPKISSMSPYILSGPSYGGVDDMSGGRMRLSIRTECEESHKFDVRVVVNREIKRICEENGIEIC